MHAPTRSRGLDVARAPTPPARACDAEARPHRPPPNLSSPAVRSAGAVMMAVLLLALVLGVVRLQRDVGDELAGAAGLAQLAEALSTAPASDDEPVLERLRHLQGGGAPRHLRLQVHDAAGRELLPPRPLEGGGLVATLARWLDGAPGAAPAPPAASPGAASQRCWSMPCGVSPPASG